MDTFRWKYEISNHKFYFQNAANFTPDNKQNAAKFYRNCPAIFLGKKWLRSDFAASSITFFRKLHYFQRDEFFKSHFL